MGNINCYSVYTCMRNNQFLYDFLSKQSDTQLVTLYTNQQSIAEELEHLFHRFDENGNGQLELEEFHDICIQIEPQINRDQILMFQRSLVDPTTKFMDINKFKEFFIPIFKSKVEQELFRRKIINKGKELGANKSKLKNMMRNIDEIIQSSHHTIKI